MEPLEIIEKITEAFPGEVLDSTLHRGQGAVIVRRDRIVDICRRLRDGKTRMNHMMCLCGVDNKARDMTGLERFEVVYHLYSMSERHMIRLRAQVPEEDAVIDSITPLWSGADWPERECYDLLGISFRGHPDLRRILLPADWQGHPLRKEYPLRGDSEWQGMVRLKEKAMQLRRFDFYPELLADSKKK